MHPIVCELVSKVYRTKQKETVIAIEEISLDVREGELMMLIGKTGAGKTTLLRLLSAFSKPDRGEISLLGENLLQFSPEEKAVFFAQHIGIVSEDIPLIDAFSVEENLRFPLLCNRTNLKLQESIVEKLLSSFGLMSRKTSLPKELSQGEKQIVALARAMIHEPRILLLDDPFSGLDHQIGMKFTTLLRSQALDKGTAILMSTHDVRLYPFAHRLTKMYEGRIAEVLGEAAVFEPPPPYMRI